MQEDLVTLICLQRIKGRKFNLQEQGKKFSVDILILTHPAW